MLGVILYRHNKVSEEDILRAETVEAAALQSLPASSSTPDMLRIPIFIYHSIRPHIEGEDAEQEAYDITPELLEKQLSYLDKNGYTAISMNDFVAYVSNGYSPVRKPVVLTFDDGWRNQYVYAFPLLKKYKMTATFYIYTNPIDHDKPNFMTWDMIRELDKAGMTIGSHSVTHPYIHRLSPDDLKRELARSKSRLEEEIGHPVLHFAAPFGTTNELIEKTAREAGYTTSRTLYRGAYHAKSDFLRLRAYLVTDRFKDFVSVLKD